MSTLIGQVRGEEPSRSLPPDEEREYVFKLVGANKLYIDRKLEAISNVTGTFVGRVKGHAIDHDSGRVTNLIEVLEATVE